MATVDNQTNYIGGTTNDVIGGTAGDDFLVGGPNTAGAPPNNDNDVIYGKGGNDTLTGGAGNDKFVFSFNFQTFNTPGQPIYEMVNESVSVANLTSVTVGDITYTKPADNASITAWKNWDAAVEAYIVQLKAAMAAEDEFFVAGSNTTTSFTNTNPGNVKNTGTIALDTGFNYTTQKIVGYDPGGTVSKVQGQGHDVITDFGNGNDSLVLAGLSNDTSAANYWANWLQSSVVGGNTVISLKSGAEAVVGGEFSITLLGVETSLATLVAQNKVAWSHDIVA